MADNTGGILAEIPIPDTLCGSIITQLVFFVANKYGIPPIITNRKRIKKNFRNRRIKIGLTKTSSNIYTAK